MDDRLRMHDDVDALVRRAEQVVGLDDLQALVHERRRVDADLAAHRPRRVRERLLDRHVLELGARAAAERAARGGEHELVHRARPLGAQQLVQRRVLGVDGDDLRAGGLGQRHDELAADDERLLVGEREVDALAQRRDRRPQARRADERVEHEVGARTRGRAARAPRARPAPRRRSTPRCARAAAVSSVSAMRVTPWRAACSTTCSHEPCAERPTSSKASGARETTSSACVPIEPVEPRMRRRRATASG